MATNKPTITTIQDTFTTLVSNTNTVSLDLGATGRLNTNEDSSAVAAINELELGIRGTSNNLVATDLADFTANNIVSALHELDSDLHGAGGGNAKADLTTNAKAVVDGINELEVGIRGTSNNLVATDLTTIANNLVDGVNELDSDIGARPHTNLTTSAKNLTAAINELEADIFNAEGGAKRTLASLGTTDKTGIVDAINELETAIRGTTNNYTISTTSNDLVGAVNEHDAELGTITSVAMGTTASTVSTAIKELDSDRDVLITFVEPKQAINTTATTVADAINEHDAELGTITAGAMGTTASTVSGAIAELEAEIDTLNTKVEPAQALTTTATTLSDAVNELDAEIGSTTLTTTATTLSAAINEHDTEIGAASLATSATTLRGAINELHTSIGDNIGSTHNTTTNNIGSSLNLLDSAVGNLGDLTSTISVRTNLVAAINSNKAQIDLLDSDGVVVNQTLGSLSNLAASFVGAERNNFVAALNALRADIPLIYDENGTQLN